MLEKCFSRYLQWLVLKNSQVQSGAHFRCQRYTSFPPWPPVKHRQSLHNRKLSFILFISTSATWQVIVLKVGRSSGGYGSWSGQCAFMFPRWTWTTSSNSQNSNGTIERRASWLLHGFVKEETIVWQDVQIQQTFPWNDWARVQSTIDFLSTLLFILTLMARME